MHWLHLKCAKWRWVGGEKAMKRAKKVQGRLMKKWESGEKANRPTLLTPSQGERSVLCSFQSGFTCKAGVKPGLLCSLQNISKCAIACFAPQNKVSYVHCTEHLCTIQVQHKLQ